MEGTEQTQEVRQRSRLPPVTRGDKQEPKNISKVIN